MQDQPEGSREQGQAQPTAPPTVSIPPANPPSIPPIGRQGTAKQSHDEEPDRLTKNDKVMIALTVAIALGTLVSAGAIVMQWREMHAGGKQTDALICAARINAGAARQFAKSAADINKGVDNAVIKLGQQADDSESFFRTDERAWVIVDPITILESYPAKDTFPPFFKYGFYAKNVGKTVARDVRIHIDAFYGSSPLNKNGVERTQMRTWRCREGKTFGPDKAGPQSLAPSEPSTVPVVAGGQAPRNDWYDTLVGRIDYTDAFNVVHWKTFCYYVSDDKGTLSHCISGNDEDTNPETPTKNKGK
jgi:hypothetical protein